MKDRDDMEVFSCDYNNVTYCYRLLEHNIKTYDQGKNFNFIVNVWAKDNPNNSFTVTFRLPADDIDLAMKTTEEKIGKYLNAQ